MERCHEGSLPAYAGSCDRFSEGKWLPSTFRSTTSRARASRSRRCGSSSRNRPVARPGARDHPPSLVGRGAGRGARRRFDDAADADPSKGLHAGLPHPAAELASGHVRDELELVRSTPAAQVARTWASSSARASHRPLCGPSWSQLDAPFRARGHADTAVGAHAPGALAALRGLLEPTFCTARAGSPRRAGRALRDLHPHVRFATRASRSRPPATSTRCLGGRGLLLVPSAFSWQNRA